MLGFWTLTRLIGKGSLGSVFEAERVSYGKIHKAAIKIITISKSRDFVKEVTRDIALISRLKGSDNIVDYQDHVVVPHKGSVGWDVIIRMELMTPLLDDIAQRGYTHRDIIKLGIDICRALEYCHEFNIIHRNIKPENIFISKSGNYKLGDIGIARAAERTSISLSHKDTCTYMAPEVYRGEVYNSSVDIYSLGLVLYRLLNDNRSPFLPEYPAKINYGNREIALNKRIGGAPPPAPKNADGKLADIVLKACAYDPQNRYTNPIQM